MTEESRYETDIHGDVGKLTQIGTVDGNVLIVSEKVIKETLGSFSRYSIPRTPQSSPAIDITNYIKVVVKSNRFGREVQFQVPQDMTVSAFIDLAIGILQLPWSRSMDELMIAFEFSYAIVFGGKKVPLNRTLRDAGISDGDEVQLSVTAIWTDKTKEAGREIAEMMGKNFLYDMSSLLSRMHESERHDAAHTARGVLTRSRIKSLADSCFAFVDEVGVQEGPQNPD